MTLLPENDDQPKYHPLPQKPDDHDHDPKQQQKTGDPKQQKTVLCCFDIVGIIFIVLVSSVFIWFLFFAVVINDSNNPKIYVDDVTLTQFKLSPTNNTLYYNLDVNITFENPDSNIGIHYDKIRANVMYHGQRLMTKHIQGFYLGHKKNNNVNVFVKGQQLLVLDNGVDKKELYESESKDGVYEIDLKLRIKAKLTAMSMDTDPFESKVVCQLKVPLISSQDKVSLERTQCVYKLWRISKFETAFH